MNDSTETADEVPRGSAPERIEGTREACEGLRRAAGAVGYLPSDMEIRRVPARDDPTLEYEACCARIWSKKLALTPPAPSEPVLPPD